MLGGAWITRAGRNIAKTNYHVGPKMIECFSLHFLLEGKVTLLYNGGEQTLSKGDLFCLFPYKTYEYKTAVAEEPPQMAWLAIDGPQVPLLIKQSGLEEENPILRHNANRAVRDIVQRLLGTFEGEPQQELLRQSLLYMLFELIADGVGKASPTLKQKDWLQQSIEYFQLHFTENVKVESVARLAGVNRSHFSSVFAEAVGMSPHQYIQQLRMEKGARLLGESAMNVTEIALSLGYSDLYSFTRAFTKYYGMSPSKFRSMNHGNARGSRA